MKLLLIATLLISPCIASPDQDVARWMRIINKMPHQCLSLHEAASQGNMEIALICIEQGDSPNQIDEQGNTPLHIAAAAGQHAVLNQLIKSGGDVFILDAQERRVAQLSEDEKIRKICKRAENYRKKEIAASEAIKAGNLVALKRYLSQQGSANAVDSTGRFSLLAQAVSEGNNDAALLLLKAGAKAEAPTYAGKNILMTAAARANRQVIHILLEKGANPMHRAGNGATALHDAVWENRLEALEALLPAYKSINYSPDAGSLGYPINLAVRKNRPAIVKSFLRAGLDPTKPIYNPSLLIEAENNNNSEILDMLNKAGLKR